MLKKKGEAQTLNDLIKIVLKSFNFVNITPSEEIFEGSY